MFFGTVQTTEVQTKSDANTKLCGATATNILMSPVFDDELQVEVLTTNTWIEWKMEKDLLVTLTMHG